VYKDTPSVSQHNGLLAGIFWCCQYHMHCTKQYCPYCKHLICVLKANLRLC